MRILIVYDKPVHDVTEASGKSLKELAYFLKNFSNEVYVLTLAKENNIYRKDFYELQIGSNMSNSNRVAISIINNISIRVFNTPILYYSKILKKIDKFAPDLIITHGLASLSVNFVDILRYYKKMHDEVRILAMTDDVRQIEEHLKIKRELIPYNKKFIKFLALLIMPLYEVAIRHIAYSMYDAMVKNFDGLLFFTDEDYGYATKRYPRYKKKFFMFRRPVKDIESKNRYSIKKELNTVLFVGNCNHLPNIEAIHNIIDIASRVNQINFIVAGSRCSKYSKGNVKIVGFVNDLDTLYMKADIFVAPLKSGSGIKIKLLECFKYGIPIIGTHIAFEGYPVKNGVDCIIEDDIEKYPARIRELEDYKKRGRISENSRKIIYYFSYDEAKKAWDKILNGILDNKKS